MVKINRKTKSCECVLFFPSSFNCCCCCCCLVADDSLSCCWCWCWWLLWNALTKRSGNKFFFNRGHVTVLLFLCRSGGSSLPLGASPCSRQVKKERRELPEGKVSGGSWTPSCVMRTTLPPLSPKKKNINAWRIENIDRSNIMYSHLTCLYSCCLVL